MNNTPLISVIISTMNRGKVLETALQSLCFQTFKNFEVVIVNDFGVDPWPHIEPYTNELNIVYINNEKNIGLAASRNKAIRAAQGKYIAYLDDDDFYYEDHLELLITVIQKTNAAVVYSDANIATEKNINGVWTTVLRYVAWSSDFNADKMLRTNYIPVLCIMHEKQCLEVVGYFKEYLRSHEDWDLWMRLSRFYNFVHLASTTCEVISQDAGSSLTQDKTVMRKTWEYTRSLGSFLEQSPRVQELANNIAQAETIKRSVKQQYDISIIFYIEPKSLNLNKSIKSLIQNIPNSSEIIVVIDDEDIMLPSIIGLLGKDVTIIKHHKYVGRTLANNHATQFSKGEILIFISSDTILHNNAISALLEASALTDNKAIITACIQNIDKTRYYGGSLAENGKLHFIKEATPSHEFNGLLAHSDAGHANCLLIPRDIFYKTKGFSIRYAPCFYEDADFCLRAFRDNNILTMVSLKAKIFCPRLLQAQKKSTIALFNAEVFATDWGIEHERDIAQEEWGAPIKISTNYSFRFAFEDSFPG